MKKLAKVLAAIILTTAVMFAAGCVNGDQGKVKKVTTENDDSNSGSNGSYNGHEYVDHYYWYVSVSCRMLNI